jgi:hypothetical protein
MKKRRFDGSAPVNTSGHAAGHPDSRFRTAWKRFSSGAVRAGRGPSRSAAFRIMYERFRELLVLNDSTLELIADIEDLIGNPRRF